MKTKIAMTFITNTYKMVFRCGYCDLCNIFKYDDANFYNCGVYGWNCDIYTYGLTAAITTGYRNMRGVRIPDDILKKYDGIAKKILENTFKKPYEEIYAELEANREEFWEALMEYWKEV